MDAEERGQAEAIARNLLEMAKLEVPVVAVVLGEGGCGGALALGVADRVLMMENAIYSVISPEGCASILWKDAAQAPKAAAALKLTAPHLLELGVIDGIVKEPLGGAHSNYDSGRSCAEGSHRGGLLRTLRICPADQLVEERYQKFARIGRVG